MTKKCRICKAVPSPISNRSFHLFPKCESARKRWVDAVNVSKTLNFKTTYICSDHFDKESFFPSYELKDKKRLRPEAVPGKKNFSSFLLQAENLTKESVIISINNSKVSDVIKDVSLQAHVNEKTEMSMDKLSFTHSLKSDERNVSKDISLQLHPDKEIELRTDEMLSRDPLDCEKSNESPAGGNTETVDLFELKSNSTPNDESNSKKRKNSFADVGPAKRVRFMDGFKTEYIRREDFIDDEAWNRFLKFLSYQKSKTAAAHNRNSRKKRKIRMLNNKLTIFSGQ